VMFQYPKESSSKEYTGCYLKEQVVMGEDKYSLSF